MTTAPYQKFRQHDADNATGWQPCAKKHPGNGADREARHEEPEVLTEDGQQQEFLWESHNSVPADTFYDNDVKMGKIMLAPKEGEYDVHGAILKIGIIQATPTIAWTLHNILPASGWGTRKMLRLAYLVSSFPTLQILCEVERRERHRSSKRRPADGSQHAARRNSVPWNTRDSVEKAKSPVQRTHRKTRK